jgi:hypothetical protein
MGKFNNKSAGYELSDSKVLDDYFLWLCRLIENQDKHNYFILLEKLHHIDFEWTVPNDDNRESDGIELRDRYIDAYGLGFYERITLGQHCSVLEMMISISERMEDIMLDEYDESYTIDYWFWELIKNLGLYEYYDESNIDYFEYNIEVKVYTMLRREYNYNGLGGLFPLKNCTDDQRNIEIWYQMQAYLIDKYHIDM